MADIEAIRTGDHLFCSGEAPSTFGSVRAVTRGAGGITGWIENHGEVQIEAGWIAAVHDGKVELDPKKLPDEIRAAIARAHEREVM
jgi:hypothetical protein